MGVLDRATEGMSVAEKVALKLIWACDRLEKTTRPIDHKTAIAELDGMCKIVAELHSNVNDNTVQFLALKVFADNGGRAPMNAMNAQPRIDWERKTARELAEAIRKG